MRPLGVDRIFFIGHVKRSLFCIITQSEYQDKVKYVAIYENPMSSPWIDFTVRAPHFMLCTGDNKLECSRFLGFNWALYVVAIN